MEQPQGDPVISQAFSQVKGDRYQIQSLLGKRTGRRTFLAKDTQTNRWVVIKLVLFGPDFTWQDLKLFEREAKTLQSLQHSAIPKYLDSFEVDTPIGKGFALVQTYLEAKSLQAWVREGHTFDENELRAIATGLLNILQYLHQRQPPVIHRDIKPSNILLPTLSSMTAGGVYLIDFGSVQTALSTDTMTVVGTYGYMPPEQFGQRARPASDLYSLGATLIYLITGQHPADLTNDSLQIQFEAPPHITPSFAHWIAQLTQTNLSQRTPSATDALRLLNQPPSEFDQIAFIDRTRALITPTNESPLTFRSGHKDLTIFSSETQLEIQFASDRLTDYKSGGALEGCLSFACILVLFVFGLAMGGGLFLIGFAMWAAASSGKKRQKQVDTTKSAHLTVQTTRRAANQISLVTRAYESGTVQQSEVVSDATLHTIEIDRYSQKLMLTYEVAQTEKMHRISIHGSIEDIRWLSTVVSQWDGFEEGTIRRR